MGPAPRRVVWVVHLGLLLVFVFKEARAGKGKGCAVGWKSKVGIEQKSGVVSVYFCGVRGLSEVVNWVVACVFFSLGVWVLLAYLRPL